MYRICQQWQQHANMRLSVVGYGSIYIYIVIMYIIYILRQRLGFGYCLVPPFCKQLLNRRIRYSLFMACHSNSGGMSRLWILRRLFTCNQLTITYRARLHGLGDIPIMVRSLKCNLYGACGENKSGRRCGSSPSSVGGQCKLDESFDRGTSQTNRWTI